MLYAHLTWRCSSTLTSINELGVNTKINQLWDKIQSLNSRYSFELLVKHAKIPQLTLIMYVPALHNEEVEYM